MNKDNNSLIKTSMNDNLDNNRIEDSQRLKSRSPDYCDETKPDKFNPNWMKDIPDDTLVSNLSIPGTHDSGARYGTFFAECQAWTIADQLKAGLRYFDIRCRRVKDIFCIHHNMMYQHLHFGEILNDIEAFFLENPSEGVIMRIKEEYKPDEPTDTFENIFKKYTEAWDGNFLLSDKIPTMKEMRGKVWVLQDGHSLNSYSWGRLDVQDDYNLGVYTSLDTKKKEIFDQMKAANTGKGDILYGNHCSATGVLFEEPLYVAKSTNKIIFKGDEFSKIGITIFDFPGEGVIKYVIDKNIKSGIMKK